MSDSVTDELFKLVSPVKCRKCDIPYLDAGLGMYKCPKCGFEEQGEFGKVRTFLEEYGNAPATVISDATGIPVKRINKFLREGKLEIPEGSDIYIKCEKCGIDIRYGRFCPDCGLKLCKNIQGALNASEIGEVPKKAPGKMRFLENRYEK